MSLTAIAASLALIASLLPLLLIARRDPKRLRGLAATHLAPHGRGPRRTLTLFVLLPGAVLIGFGDWPAFLIWLGALTASGWLLVQWLAVRV
ncbi:hypothetical protein [Nevskia sp.]|uniref:hypothetical protein n=1 Tax=Nevskia sp. TaxID=1929292 RepID=UPI0025EE1D8D|nr:hypothetical protein [Nevskia sp.]